MLFLVYHKGCPDGCCAAHNVMRFLKGRADPILIPFSHNDQYELPDGAAGSTFILVDFVYSEPVMRELLQVAKAVFIIDHHQTAIDMNLESTNLTSVIRSDAAASLLTWNIFFSEPPPRYVELISDFDSGRDQIPQALSLKYYMSAQRNLVPEFFDDAESQLNSWLDQGAEILKKTEERAKIAYSRTKLYEFEEHTVLVVVDDMDVLNYYNDAFADDVDFILFFRQNYRNKTVKVSARSKRPINLLKLKLWKSLTLKGHMRAAAGIIHQIFADLNRDLISRMLKPSAKAKPEWKGLLACHA